MVVTEILLLRHGHRIAWTLDPTKGKYTSNVPYPTRLPADPPLASHGVLQAEETGCYLEEELGKLAAEDRLRVYSSLFYRCPETLRPTVQRLRQNYQPGLKVRGERGIGEWFGAAWFDQPVPAEPSTLQKDFFPWFDANYNSLVIPERKGERIHQLHDRIAQALELIVNDVDAEYKVAGRDGEEVTLLLCGHAAQIIATGRVLTGVMPDDTDVEDFKCFTCGLSKFTRRTQHTTGGTAKWKDWRNNGGVAGGWTCVLNSWCGHLSQGEERGWHFHGDEDFDSYEPGVTITEDGGVPEKDGTSSDSQSKL